MPRWDGRARRGSLATLIQINTLSADGLRASGAKQASPRADARKKRLQGGADIGILYSPNS
jgi:hypothetical protein